MGYHCVLFLGSVLFGDRNLSKIARFYLRMVPKLDKDIVGFDV